MRILILVSRNLAVAPRPQKEARALALAGHDVTVMGFWTTPEAAARDEALLAGAPYRFRALVDARSPRWRERLRYAALRIRSRIARELFHRGRMVTPDLLGSVPRLMLREARRHRADLTIAHSESSMWVAAELLREGFRVGIDVEDWFSRDLPEEVRRSRPIAEIERLEGLLLRRASYRLATSQAMAEALARTHAVPPPAVVYNAFPFAERATLDGAAKDRTDRTRPSLHWFSQTIGPGRGLEELFAALALLGGGAPQLHLRGDLLPTYRGWLGDLLAKAPGATVRVHPTVPNGELLSRIAEHDIGLALERTDIPNKDLTISNKLFQYLLGGLAVIATPTAGQREVLDHAPGAGELVPCGDAQALAAAIGRMTGDAAALARMKAAALAAAERRFCWEHQEPVLLAEAARALAPA